MDSIKEDVQFLLDHNDHALLRKAVKRISDFELSVRLSHCMNNDNCHFVGDIAIQSDVQLLRTPSFGKLSLKEIKEVIFEPNQILNPIVILGWPENARASPNIINPLKERLAELELASEPVLAPKETPMIGVANLSSSASSARLRQNAVRNMYNWRISNRHHIPL